MNWDYLRLLIIVCLAGFVGLLFGQMVIFMFVATFVYALWLQRSWYQLYSWVKKPKKHLPPSAEGVMNDVCGQIERVRKQNRSRKKKLADYLKRFQATTAALPDAIVVLGDDGLVDWSNAAAADLLGIHWPRDSQVRLASLIQDFEFQQLLSAAVDGGRVIIVSSPIKEDMLLEMKIVRYMKSGRLLIARDITQTVKLQRMRRDFVANVSHELRTPLTVLRGYLETFTQQSPAEQWGAAMPVMRQQAQRMHLMIKDLLELSQLETGEKELCHEDTDIAVLLAAVIEDAKKLEQYHGHKLELDIASKHHLLADVDELRSAVSNLVFNAVKYTPSGTKITVRWCVGENGARIEVNDEGEGIPEHHLERLTERFYRVDSGRSQDAGGTGLGLAIVKHVLQRHGAELKISSEIGVGTQFCCCFPITSIAENDSLQLERE